MMTTTIMHTAITPPAIRIHFIRVPSMDPRKEAVGLTELGRFATALCGACAMTLRRERGPAQELEPMQRRVAITIAELSEHVFDERRLENRVGGADADAGGGQAELHFPAV